MKNLVGLVAPILLAACSDVSQKSLANANSAVSNSIANTANSPAVPKRSIADDPRISARTLIRDDDKGSEWAKENDSRVEPASRRIESISAHTGEKVSSIMLAIDGAAARLKVTRVQLLADVDDALAKGNLKRGQDTTFGMDVWAWATSKYKKN